MILIYFLLKYINFVELKPTHNSLEKTKQQKHEEKMKMKQNPLFLFYSQEKREKSKQNAIRVRNCKPWHFCVVVEKV